jgi:hypothetical protein
MRPYVSNAPRLQRKEVWYEPAILVLAALLFALIGDAKASDSEKSVPTLALGRHVAVHGSFGQTRNSFSPIAPKTGGNHYRVSKNILAFDGNRNVCACDVIESGVPISSKNMGLEILNNVDRRLGRDVPKFNDMLSRCAARITIKSAMENYFCFEVYRWRLPIVDDRKFYAASSFFCLFFSYPCPLEMDRDIAERQVSSNLRLADFPGGFDRFLGRKVSLPRQMERCQQEYSAYPDEPSLYPSVIPHVLRCIIHVLRGFVHALLGSKVIYLALAGLGFAAIAGVGCGLILDNFNRERKRVRLGWLLLLICLPLFVANLLLSLP